MTAQTATQAVPMLMAACDHSLAAIDEREAGLTEDDYAQMPRGEHYGGVAWHDLEIIENRRTIAASIHAMGIIGQRLARAGDAETTLAIAKHIAPYTTRPDPGLRWP